MPSSTFVISITPFSETGALDEDAFRRHLRRMAAGGVGVYVGGGGSGEGYTLDEDETRRVVEIAVEELRGRVPVRAMGVEPRLAADMIRYIRMADAAGVDACQVYSLDQGHGHRPTEDEVEAYFTDILSAVSSPCVISTHQSVGYQVRVPLLTRLVERFDHVIGINSSHQDHGYLARIIDAVGDRVTVHVGGPAQGLLNLSLGGTGFLTSEANLAPHLCAAVTSAFDAGDQATVFGSFGKVVRLSDTLYRNGGIRVTKAVLNSLGLPGGYPRKPQLPVSDRILATVREAVDRLDLASIEGWPAHPTPDQ
jgi:4-hydroxy-tetrahydrodipicolinate synthase